MKPERKSRWQRRRDVFAAALELPIEERKSFVQEACAGHSSLGREVDALLRESEKPVGPLDAPLVSFAYRDETHWLGHRIGSCLIERLLGVGGMGAVYLAQQQSPARTVAIKFIRFVDPSLGRRFEQEIRALGRLRHQGIAQIYEAGVHRDEETTTPYFVMEYVTDAKTLLAYADRAGLNARERLELFAQAGDAIQYGHQSGVIHRDIKPSNVLVDIDGNVKIIDFGLAILSGEDETASALTAPGKIIGTIDYMSPEQLGEARSDVDVRSDVYALGVLLYELICGRKPYNTTDATIAGRIRAVCEGPIPRPSSVRREVRGDLEMIILKGLQKDRTQRYQSVGELVDDVRRYLRREPITARTPGILYHLRVFVRRNPSLIAAASIALLTALVALFIVGRQQFEARQLEAERRGRENAMKMIELLVLPKSLRHRPSRSLHEYLPANEHPSGEETLLFLKPQDEFWSRMELVQYALRADGSVVVGRGWRTLTIPEDVLGFQSTVACRTTAAIFADILPAPGNEIATAYICDGCSWSALCITGTDLSQSNSERFVLWHDGNITDMAWSENPKCLSFVAHGNGVLAADDALGSTFARLKPACNQSNPILVVGIDPDSLTGERGVIHPLDSESLPVIKPMFIVMLEPQPDWQVSNNRRVEFEGCAPSEKPGAVCRASIRVSPPDAREIILFAHLGPDGSRLGSFETENGSAIEDLGSIDPGLVLDIKTLRSDAAVDASPLVPN